MGVGEERPLDRRDAAHLRGGAADDDEPCLVPSLEDLEAVVVASGVSERRVLREHLREHRDHLAIARLDQILDGVEPVEERDAEIEPEAARVAAVLPARADRMVRSHHDVRVGAGSELRAEPLDERGRIGDAVADRTILLGQQPPVQVEQEQRESAGQLRTRLHQLDRHGSRASVARLEPGVQMSVLLDERLLVLEHAGGERAVPREAPVVVPGDEDLPRPGRVELLAQHPLAVRAILLREPRRVDVVAEEDGGAPLRVHVSPDAEQGEGRVVGIGSAGIADQQETVHEITARRRGIDDALVPERLVQRRVALPAQRRPAARGCDETQRGGEQRARRGARTRGAPARIPHLQPFTARHHVQPRGWSW